MQEHENGPKKNTQAYFRNIHNIREQWLFPKELSKGDKTGWM